MDDKFVYKVVEVRGLKLYNKVKRVLYAPCRNAFIYIFAI